jgi:hypothetical protein
MAIKKSKVKPKPSVKNKSAKVKPISKNELKSKSVKKNRIAKMNKSIATKPVAKSLEKLPVQTMDESRQMMVPQNKRVASSMVKRSRVSSSKRVVNQFNFMKAPITEHAFEVGDNVEVFCDHEKSRERIRGWIKGIVVQVDNKMVAVQFRSNVFLTDGWMVPDRILWYPLISEHIRPVQSKKAVVKKEFIPDY